MILFKDISGVGQGVYNMDANPDQMVMIKMSGGDGISQVLYYDDQAGANYNNAIRLGKVPFMYHFYGGGDPVTEADFFYNAVAPLTEGDGYALDIERGTRWNPQLDPDAVIKVTAFVNHFHERTGVWPWIYMNISTANMYDWSPVFNNCAYWCAAPSFGFNDTLPVKYSQTAQQGPIVDGVDTDAVFVDSLDQLKKFTYHVAPTPPAPVVVTVPTVDPPLVTPNPPVPTPPVVLPDLTNNVPIPPTITTVWPASTTSTYPTVVTTPNIFQRFIAWLKKLLHIK